MVNLVDYWAYQPNSNRKSALMREMFSAASVSREREMTLLKRSSSLTHIFEGYLRPAKFTKFCHKSQGEKKRQNFEKCGRVKAKQQTNVN